jgi:formylglycine-generating enzyme required for sulfatase activity
VYVVLTMRSDFLGDCAQFPGLPEALNQSQYLIPRLTREQRREAIEKPLALVGARMTPSLVQRLLYELGDDPDQLPVLQHALNRTWQKWKDDLEPGDIQYRHYESAGTLQGALNDHAESLMEGLHEDAVGKVFRCLTMMFDGRKIRRPASLDRVMAVAGEGNAAAARAVVERYADPANSLLVLSPPGALDGKTMVDIAHESLIRRWKRLDQWVDDEADCVRWYADVVEDTRRLRAARVKTWRDPKLAYARKLLANVWNEAWAEWAVKDSPVPFKSVTEFLNQGALDQAAEEEQKEAERQSKLDAERQAKEAAQARAAAERAAAESARKREIAEQQAKEAALATAEAERLRADAQRAAAEDARSREAAEREAKEMALARESAERGRKRWLAAGLALALLLVGALALALWSYRRVEQQGALLLSTMQLAERSRQLAADAAASLRENDRRRAELEARLKDTSGQSETETRKLKDELAKLNEKSSEDEKVKRAAEARLKEESAAVAQLREQVGQKDSLYAQAVKRAADLDREVSKLRDENQKLTARLSAPATADSRVAEELRDELRLARMKIDSLDHEVQELRRKVAGRTPQAGDKRVHTDGLTYVWIPPGKFRMGCSPGDSECVDDENPAHEVTISTGFWIGQTEVTQRAWKKTMKTANPSEFKDDDRPVEKVDWSDASGYCRAIGGRLPTEAEWEYAARAGSEGATYGPVDLVAWHSRNAKKTEEVARKQPNAWGLYDMLGNVWEWVADWYVPYGAGAVKDPRGPAQGSSRALRGGSWYESPRDVRASNRIRFVPTDRGYFIGFRCAGEFP